MVSDMNGEELAATLATYRSEIDQLRREIKRVEDHAAQELMSVLQAVTAGGTMTAELHTLICGANHQGGVIGDIHALRAKLEISDEKLKGAIERVQDEQEAQKQAAADTAEAQERAADARAAVLRRYILGLVATITGAVILKWALDL